jgi:hypothetical protein
MNFDVFGPFEIPRVLPDLTIIDNRKNHAVENVSQDADNDNGEPKGKSGLSNAPGCYVFVMKAAKGYMPWYVGKSVKPAFTTVEEALSPQKVNKYNYIISQKKGTPMLFIVAALTDGGKFCKRTRNGLLAVNFVEQWLIGQALNKNPELLNVHYAGFLRSLHVPGMINPKPGKPSAAVQELVHAIS